MRSDFHKLLVEHPRVAREQSWLPVRALNRKRNAYREAKRFKLDENLDVCDLYCSAKLPMKSRRLGYRQKMFGENLNPLWRFLKKRVGQPWNDVYSEICVTLDCRTTIQYHVFQHLSFDVCTKTKRTHDGRVMRWSEVHGYCDYENSFYVDPDTGVLMVGTHRHPFHS